jgi:hypothetical protein
VIVTEDIGDKPFVDIRVFAGQGLQLPLVTTDFGMRGSTQTGGRGRGIGLMAIGSRRGGGERRSRIRNTRGYLQGFGRAADVPESPAVLKYERVEIQNHIAIGLYLELFHDHFLTIKMV